MRDNVEVPVAVVSSRRELDLAISTWVPGYLARRAPDIDTVIDLTSDGGLVLLDLADEDRTDWLAELRSRGFDGPLVVITPPDSRDHAALAGNVLVPGPLQVELLEDAFDAALRRHRHRGRGRHGRDTATPLAPAPSPATSKTAPASASAVADEVSAEGATSAPTAPTPPTPSTVVHEAVSTPPPPDTPTPERNREAKPRRGLLRRRRAGRSEPEPSADRFGDGDLPITGGADPVVSDAPEGMPPPAAAWEVPPGSADDDPTPARSGPPPPPPLPARGPTWEEPTAPPAEDRDDVQAADDVSSSADPDDGDEALSSVVELGFDRENGAPRFVLPDRSPSPEAPPSDQTAPSDAADEAAAPSDAAEEVDGAGKDDASSAHRLPTLTRDRALVVSDAAACAWLLLEDLDLIVRDGGGIVALRGADGQYATAAGIGIAPMEGATQVALDHPLLAEAGPGPAVLHVPDTATTRLPIDGLPLADCPALLLMLVPGGEDAAAIVLIGRGAPFERHELDTVSTAVHDVPSLLHRIHRARHEDEVRRAGGGGVIVDGHPGIFPGSDDGPARIVAGAASAAWRLVHDAYPLLEDASALVAFRGTGGWYTPVAATRVRALEGIRAVPEAHPLLGRIRAGEGSTLFIPRAEEATSTAGLPLGHEASIMVIAIGPADDPDALLMIGSPHIVRASELEPFEQLVTDAVRAWPAADSH